MRGLFTLIALVALAACGGGATRGEPASAATATATHPHTASPGATPLINVDAMMGLYAQQTVFVASADRVSAVTLLNHFTRYEIATAGQAQVAVDPKGAWLYVLDTPGGRTRLRTFDVDGGIERARRENLTNAASGRRSLATAFDGEVLVLRSDASRSWIDAYSAVDLAPLAPLAEKSGCADRLLVSAGRIAIVCLADGSMAVRSPSGTVASVEGPAARLVATTMTEDGAIYVATADRRLAVVAVGSQKLLDLDWPSEWMGTVLPDSLAASAGAIVPGVLVLAQQADVPYARVFVASNLTQRQSLRLSGTPQGGLLVLWPFAYFTVGQSVRHIDLSTGLLEVMREDLGANPIPGAIAAR